MSARKHLVPAKPPVVGVLPENVTPGTVVGLDGIAYIYNHNEWWETVPIIVSETPPEDAPENAIWIGPPLDSSTPDDPIFDLSNVMGVVIHGEDGSVERPEGYVVITWVGSVLPLNIGPNDIWYNDTEDATPQEVDLSGHEGDEDHPHAAAGYIRGNFDKLTASVDPPENPSPGDVWIKILEAATPYTEIDVSVPIGGIIMYSGNVLSLSAGWALCDGTNGTPDLRGMFIVGAGGAYTQGDTGGSETVTLTTAQMPVHTHTGPSHSHSVGSLTTNSTGSHSHALPYRTNDAVDHNHKGTTSSVAQGGTGAGENWSTTLTDIDTLAEGSHSHTISGSTAAAGTGVTGSSGSGEAHENRPPYYALAYIMRVDPLAT